MVIEQVTPKEEITALRKLLHEALSELEYLHLSQPRVASANGASILERGRVALGVSNLREEFRP